MGTEKPPGSVRRPGQTRTLDRGSKPFRRGCPRLLVGQRDRIRARRCAVVADAAHRPWRGSSCAGVAQSGAHRSMGRCGSVDRSAEIGGPSSAVSEIVPDTDATQSHRESDDMLRSPRARRPTPAWARDSSTFLRGVGRSSGRKGDVVRRRRRSWETSDREGRGDALAVGLSASFCPTRPLHRRAWAGPSSRAISAAAAGTTEPCAAVVRYEVLGATGTGPRSRPASNPCSPRGPAGQRLDHSAGSSFVTCRPPSTTDPKSGEPNRAGPRGRQRRPGAYRPIQDIG